MAPRAVRTAAAFIGRISLFLRAEAEKAEDLLKEARFLGGLLGA
jgi:hypothetical protein